MKNPNSETTDKFNRTWTTTPHWNRWEKGYFCTDCRQPIPTWYDEPQNRGKQVCNHRKFGLADAYEMGARIPAKQLSPSADLLETLKGTEVRSCLAKHDYVTITAEGSLIRFGKVVVRRLTRLHLNVLMNEVFRQEFGTGDVQAVLEAEFGIKSDGN